MHLDVVVDDLDAALARARSAGATLEREVVTRKWGRMANLGDPFGHGLCLPEFSGRGYDELLEEPAVRIAGAGDDLAELLVFDLA